jgi:carbonic anhydrase
VLSSSHIDLDCIPTDFLVFPHPVVVVGHTQCGGAAACYNASKTKSSAPPSTALERWLAPLTKLASSLQKKGASEVAALDELVEENVKMQVSNICKTKTVLGAWAEKKDVWVHGWVFDIAQGTLRDVGATRGP